MPSKKVLLGQEIMKKEMGDSPVGKELALQV